MKWSVVLLVLAAVCAAVNADCCRCVADQGDLVVVKTNNKTVTVTVDPKRGDCSNDVPVFMYDSHYLIAYEKLFSYTQSSTTGEKYTGEIRGGRIPQCPRILQLNSPAHSRMSSMVAMTSL